MKIRILAFFLFVFFFTNLKGQITKISDFTISNPFDDYTNYKTVASIGNKYLYTGTGDEDKGKELWISDGTKAGTKMVKDISPGAPSTNFNSFIVMNNVAYFIAETKEKGSELWRSDGTEAGTKIVKDIDPTGSALSLAFGKLFVFNNKLYFSAYTDATGREPWSSDGTEAGTKILADINPGTSSSSPEDFFEFNGKLYFFAKPDSFDPVELWSSDGTPIGTKKFKVINEKSEASGGKFGASNDKTFYFTAASGFNVELWKSDGTATNTKFVTLLENTIAEIVGLANGKALFTLNGGTHEDDLWVTDGTEAGTKVLFDAKYFIKRTPYSLIKFEGNAYCFINDEDDALILKTDGTTTASIAKFKTTTSGGDQFLIPFSKEFLIIGYRNYDENTEIYTSKGTEASTVLLSNHNKEYSESSMPSDFIELSNTNIVFKAEEISNDRELFMYNRSVPLTSQINVTGKIICNNDKTGELTVESAGGTMPYSYLWSNDEKKNKISNLSAGDYKVTVTDASGNSSIASVTLINPSPLIVTEVVTSETPNIKNGKIMLTVSGGVAPYTYKWNDGKTIKDISNIAAGIFKVTITDKNGCTFSKEIVVPLLSSNDELDLCMNNMSSTFDSEINLRSCLSFKKDVEILKTSGAVLYKSTFTDLLNVDTNDYISGAYIIRIYNVEKKLNYSRVIVKI